MCSKKGSEIGAHLKNFSSLIYNMREVVDQLMLKLAATAAAASAFAAVVASVEDG